MVHTSFHARVAIALTGVLMLASCHSQSAAPAEANYREPTETGHWIQLFDGKTTNGWHTFKKTTVTNWGVHDGILTREKDGGDLVTDGKYGNYILEMDWRMPPGGNSGVIYRTDETESATHWVGPEIQIIETPPNNVHATGACYDLYPPIVDARKQPGEWNHFRIILDGPHITHYLNGQKVCEYTIGSPDWNERVARSKFKTHPKFATLKSGEIALQDHHANVEFKNIRLMPIEK